MPTRETANKQPDDDSVDDGEKIREKREGESLVDYRRSIPFPNLTG